MAANTSDLVMTAAAVAAVSTAGALYYEHTLRAKLAKVVLGAFGLGVVLSLVAAASDQVGRAFAWLIIIGALSLNGARIVAARGK